jgi:hypothetical protein
LELENIINILKENEKLNTGSIHLAVDIKDKKLKEICNINEKLLSDIDNLN